MLTLVRLSTALLPLALAPLLVHLMASGTLDLGGGEKDLIWILPWILWSCVFAASALVHWRGEWSLTRSLLRSAVLALIAVFLVAMILAILGQLGVAGRL